MDRREGVRDLACIGALIAVAAVLFADVLLAGAGFYQRDLFAYHYALRSTVVATVQGGAFPYWNRFISGGQPLAANPAFGLWYPPQWLTFIAPYATTFQLHILLHVAVALAGMFLFLRALGLTRPAAVFGAASFGLGGLLLGTMSMLQIFFVWAWGPFCALTILRFLLSPTARRFAIATIVCAVPILLFEPVSLSELWILLFFGVLWRETFGSRQYVRAARSLLAIGAAAAAVAAVVIIPAIDHVRDSVRSRGFAYETVMQYSMPVERPLEIVIPHLYGPLDPAKGAFWGAGRFNARAPYANTFFCGFGVLILVLAGLFLRMRGSRFLVITAGITYAIAIGPAGPVMPMVFAAGMRSVRYPEKFFVAACVVAIIFAAAAADRFLKGEISRPVLTAAAIVAAINVALAAMTFAPFFPALFFEMWHLPASAVRLALAARATWTIDALLAITWLVFLYLGRRERSRPWLIAAALILLLDIGRFIGDVAPRAPRSFFAPPAAEAALRGDDGRFAIFHRGRWLPDDANYRAQNRLEPGAWLERNALLPYTPFLGGHRTTLEPDWDESALLPTHALLDKLMLLGSRGGEWSAPLMTIANVGTVIDYAPPNGSESDVENAMPVMVRGVPFRQPRYFFATKLVPAGDFESYVRAHPVPLATAFVDGPTQQASAGRVNGVRETSNAADIDVESFGQSFLVMTVTRHKYWRVAIDGKPVPVVAANFAFQGVPVPPGRHRVTMRYSNPLIPVSGGVSLVALAAAIAAIVRKPRT